MEHSKALRGGGKRELCAGQLKESQSSASGLDHDGQEQRTDTTGSIRLACKVMRMH